MSNGIEKTLGLRSMEGALKEQQGEIIPIDIEEEEYDPYTLPEDFDRSLSLQVNQATKNAIGERMLSGKDTDEKLDTLYDALMEHSETMARLALELEPGKAPRAFEVLNGIMKNAMDAVNSKRDHELKTMRLMLEQQKFEHEKSSNVAAPVGSTDAIVAVSTMADLVRNFRKAIDDAPVTETRTSSTD